MRAEDKEIEVAQGIKFPAWVCNSFLPGPTLRATEGDRIIIHFENRASKPHTIHFHGIHPANMDGVFEVIPKGRSFTYAFIADHTTYGRLLSLVPNQNAANGDKLDQWILFSIATPEMDPNIEFTTSRP